MIEIYNPKSSKTFERCDLDLSNIFIRYAEEIDDDHRNVDNKTDFTSFSWNINHKNFQLDDITKKQIQDDANKLCLLEREYSLNKNEGCDENIISDRIKKIIKILDKIQKVYPNVVINENIRNI